MNRQRLGHGCAGILLALMLAGCSTSAMKTTPIWDDDYGKGVGPVEDRVNLWPVLYWRNPALSVLWPLFSKTDEGNALIPLYEYHKADGDLRLGTIHQAFPALLAHWNRDEDLQRVLLGWRDGRHREFNVFPIYFQHYDPEDPSLLILPVFYHDKTGTWTPLASKSENLVGVLGPLFNRYHRGDYSQWNLPWPLAGWWSSSREAGSKLIPAYYYNHDGDAKTLNVGALLLHRKWDQSDDRLNYLFPLGARGHRGDRAWNRLIPLWYWKRDRQGSRLYSLPLVRTGDGGSTTTVAMGPAYVDHRTSGTRYQAWAWPLVHRFSNPEESGHAVVPLYLTKQTVAGTRTVYSLPASWRTDGSLLNFGVLLFNLTDRDGRREGAVLWPLARWWSGKEESGSSVLPLYYWDRRGEDEALLINPVYSFARSPERTITDLLGPVYFANTATDGKRAYRSVLWPLWHQKRDGDEHWNALFPVYSYRRSPRGTRFVSIPFLRDASEDAVETGLGLNVIGWSSNTKTSRLKHHAFPLYSWRSDPERADLDVGLSLLGSIGWSRRDEAALRGQMVGDLQKRLDKETSLTLADPKRRSWTPTAYENLYHRNAILEWMNGHARLDGRLEPVAESGTTSPGATVLTDASGKRWQAVIEKHVDSQWFPFYLREVDGDARARREILWRLYDSRMRRNDDGSVYRRQRVLWRLLHRETEAGRVATDIFPFIAYDRDPDEGKFAWSFAGGLVGWKREKEETTLKLLWIPIGI